MAEVEPEVLIPPTSPHEFHEDEGRRWPRVLGYLVSAAIVALVAVFVGRAIYRSISNDSPKPPTTVITQNTKKQSAPSPSTSNNTASNSGASIAAPNQLPNNGPGNVAALFAVSAVAAGSLHYAFRRRRDA